MKSSGLTKSTAWYTLGNLFVRSANFLLLPLYSNLIPPNEFGNYALLMSFYSVAMVFYQGGYQAALSKFYLKETDQSRKRVIFSTIALGAIIIALGLSLIISSLSGGISRIILNNESFASLIIFISAAMFFETAGTQFMNFLVTQEKAARVVIISASGAAINVLMNLYLVYFLNLGIEGIIIAQLVSAAFVILIISPQIYSHITFDIDPGLFKNIIMFTLPLTAGGIMSVGVDVADRFILDHYLGRTEVGIYSFAYRIALIMNLFVISFRTAWMPYALKLYYSGNSKEQFGNTLLKYIAAAGVIYISASLLVNDLFNLELNGTKFFEPSYAAGIFIIPYILGGYLLSGVSSYFSVYPFVSDKTYHFILSDGIAFLLNIILNIAFIPLYGLAGAAAATLFSFTVSAAYLFFISHVHIPIIFPVKRILILLPVILILTLTGLWGGSLFLDLVLVGMYLLILLLVLKINPLDLLRGEGIKKFNHLD